MATTKKQTPWHRWLFAIAAGVVGTQVLFGVLLWCFFPTPQDRGLFGDSFGVANTLFSGLALAGIIIALFMQREELELQREELRATREELKHQREALELQASALQRQADLSYLQFVQSLGGEGHSRVLPLLGKLTEEVVDRLRRDLEPSD